MKSSGESGEEWKKKRQGKGEGQEMIRQEKDGEKAGISGNYGSGKVGKGKEGVKKRLMWGSEEERRDRMGAVEGKTLLWGPVSARGTAPGVAYSMSCSEDCRHHRRVVWPWGFGVERG